MLGRRALGSNPDLEAALLGNAFLAADQPARLQIHDQRIALEPGADLQRHRQQHRTVIAVVGQLAERELARCRPGDLARCHASRQGPAQLGRQPRVARILPVAVPVRRMLQLQA